MCLLIYAIGVMFLVLGWLLRNEPGVQWVFPVVGPVMLILAASFHHLTVEDEGDRLSISFGARVRGDGRKYTLNLYTRRRLTAFSYRAEFQTKKDVWIEVSVPLDKFVATSFGRVVRNQPLNPSEVNGLGILLGDKKAGPFKLEVDWIKVSQPPP